LARELLSVRAEKPLEALSPSDNGETRDRRLSARPTTQRTSSQLATIQQRFSTNGEDRTPRELLKAEIHEALAKNLDLVDASKAQGDAAKLAELRGKIREITQDILAEKGLVDGAEEIARLKEEIVNEALGLGPLEDLMTDNDITEIMVNGPEEIYIERFGIIHRTPKRFANVRQLLLVIERIIAPLGRRLDEACPMVDARLPDGSRVNAIIEPLSLNGPTLTIRRFGIHRLTARDLLQKGSANESILDFLRACVEARLNICISGGTGSGKTTFLNILSASLPKGERIITIEDAAELFLSQPHVVRLESRPPNIEGTGQITIRDLVRNSLRMRPDRIVVGECRGAEALDMLQAMNTGHDGSLTTIHANSARDCLARIETMVLMAGFDFPIKAIREQVASAVNVVIQLARMRDGSRKVVNVSEIVGMEGDVITMQDIIKFAQRGVDEHGRVVGEFQYTGVQPLALRRFGEYGVEYDSRSLTYLEPAVNLW
jgi:pilus assembly protein CpaF